MASKHGRTIRERSAMTGVAGLAIGIALTSMLAACAEELSEADIQRLTSGGGAVTFSGIQTNLPESVVTGGGWSLCYSDTYDINGVSLSGIFAGCGGTQLLLACRPVGDANLTVAAHAPFADVTFDTGTDATTTHVANGVAWYYNDFHSWGYIEPGDTISKSQCDTDTGTFDDRKLCWHTGVITGAGNLDNGYRCGTTQGLNIDPNWERLIYTNP